MKMFLTNISQSTLNTQVYKYAFSVFNQKTNDREDLIAAFLNVPESEDWREWLENWEILGYQLQSKPVLIQTL